MYRDPVDSTFNRAPDFHVLKQLKEDFKQDLIMHPSTDVKAETKHTELKGPLYVLNGGVYTADELAWLLKKGYVRSDLYGRRCEVTDEYTRPKVRYIVTQKGRDSKRWF